MDFAGSYGIQTEFGKRIVKEVKGGIDNVIGLPLDLVQRLLEEAGFNIKGRK